MTPERFEQLVQWFEEERGAFKLKGARRNFE